MTGLPVRYDGSDRFSATCMVRLARVLDWLPLCPEVAAGLGTPRPTIDLFLENGTTVAHNRTDPSINPTAELENFADRVSREHGELCGYVLMARSPSCAVASGRLYRNGKLLSEQEPGIFARQWRAHHPQMPVLESTQLDNPRAVLHFLVGVYMTAAARALSSLPGHDRGQLPDILMPLAKTLSGSASGQVRETSSAAQLIRQFLVGEWPKLAETDQLQQTLAELAADRTDGCARLCADLLEAAGRCPENDPEHNKA